MGNAEMNSGESEMKAKPTLLSRFTLANSSGISKDTILSPDSDLCFVVFSRETLDAPFYFNSAQIPIHISKHHRVLFVEPVYMSILTALKNPSRVFDVLRLGLKLGCPRKKHDKLFVLSPLAFFPTKVSKAERLSLSARAIKFLNERFVLWQIRKATKKLKFKSVVFWTYQRMGWNYIGKLGEILSVYHCTDNVATFPYKNEHQQMNAVRFENELATQANIVFATERQLAIAKKAFNEDSYYIPNAADFALYSKSALPETEIPEDISNIPHPIIGFVGGIRGYSTDLSLIEYTAKQRPDWSFVFVGPFKFKEGQEKLVPRLPNIYYLGARPKETVPGYLKAFDVCIIPSIQHEHTKHEFSLKFFEYLASGKPVVATPMPAMRDFSDVFYEAKDKSEFVQKISSALNENDRFIVQRRRELASQNTWDNRIERMLSIAYKKVRQ